MITRGCILTLLLAFGFHLAVAQSDPVLFTVETEDVPLSEFQYIYTKTGGTGADYSRASLEDYLDRYVNYKLKVHRAREMKLDTVQSLQRELEGYRRQLADSYLIDREVTDKLIQEAYDRIQKDVDISHIMLLVTENATPADTLAAYQKAMDLKKQIEKGASFEELAKANSDDKSAQTNGGRIGYITALFPAGFYNLETAAYTGKTGQVMGPIRTSAGYHLLKVNAARPARGEIEAAHILIRNKQGAPKEAAKMKIDSLYQLLKNGADFEILARDNSDDQGSASRGGNIGFFGINRYEPAFEDAAFAVPADNEYSAPFESSVGWHIIKRISRRGIQPLAIERSRLEGKIKQDSRFEVARVAMIKRIKSEEKFAENLEALKPFVDTLGENFLTFKWRTPEAKSDAVLFRFGNKKSISIGDFADYLARASRKRIRLAGTVSNEEAVDMLYKEYVDEICLQFEEEQLDNKYPEFKALMREYEEGILLFEAAKMSVWDKAAQDTAGLSTFYQTVKGNYNWEKRAQVHQFTIRPQGLDKVGQIIEFARTHTAEEVIAQFNSEDQELVIAKEQLLEPGRSTALDNMEWKAGAVSNVDVNRRDNSVSFFKIEAILPPSPKTLDEARGYVIADYQDYLEKKWVDELRTRYSVKINKKEFDKLVKK